MKRDCSHCDGFWMQTEIGMMRCTFCPRGEELRTADHARRNPPTVKVLPTLTESQALAAVAKLAAIPYFPADDIVRGVIGRELMALCGTHYDASWLADRMIFLYAKWPGPRDLRIVYASRKIPHDGVMPIGISEAYPDGIPAEREPSPAMLALPAGSPVSAIPELEAAVVKLAGFKDMTPPPRKSITQADLDAAMAANRARREARPEKEPV